MSGLALAGRSPGAGQAQDWRLADGYVAQDIRKAGAYMYVICIFNTPYVLRALSYVPGRGVVAVGGSCKKLGSMEGQVGRGCVCDGLVLLECQ